MTSGIPAWSLRSMAQIARIRTNFGPSVGGETRGYELAPRHSRTLPAIGTDELNPQQRPTSPSDETAIHFAIGLVQGKWRIAILRQLKNGPVRLGELKRRLSPISKKVLNEHLREMEKEGLIVRFDRSGKIPHVEYSLASPLGFAALSLLHSIAEWGDKHSPLKPGANCSAIPGVGPF